MKQFIEINNLYKSVKEKTLLKNINLKITDNSIIGILGSNGAGKTTLIKTMMGFIKHTEGSITNYSFTPWNNTHEFIKNIGYILGEIALPLNITGDKFIKYLSEIKSIGNNDKASELIEYFQLDTSIKVKKMSKGMKQKLAIIAAFMGDHELYIFDEPMDGLDPIMQEKFNKLVLKEFKKGKTFIISSHNYQQIHEICTKVIFMKNGELVNSLDMKNIDINKFKKIFLEMLA